MDSLRRGPEPVAGRSSSNLDRSHTPLLHRRLRRLAQRQAVSAAVWVLPHQPHGGDAQVVTLSCTGELETFETVVAVPV
jgi:hypothetical protein